MNLLYVDTDPKRTERLFQYLDGECNIEVVQNGWYALGNALSGQLDCMLINLEIPIVHGVEVIRLIKSEPDLKSKPIHAFCEPHNSQYLQAAKEVGCDYVIHFPNSSQEAKRILYY